MKILSFLEFVEEFTTSMKQSQRVVSVVIVGGHCFVYDFPENAEIALIEIMKIFGEEATLWHGMRL